MANKPQYSAVGCGPSTSKKPEILRSVSLGRPLNWLTCKGFMEKGERSTRFKKRKTIFRGKRRIYQYLNRNADFTDKDR